MTKNSPSIEPPAPAMDPVVRDVKYVFSDGATDLRITPPRRRAPLWLLWGLAIPVVLVAGYFLYQWLTPKVSNGPGITGTVEKGDLVVTVTERGELESTKRVDVRCEIEGRQHKIIEILGEGVQVKKDQVVVKFDTEELTRRYAEQEVKVKAAEGKFNAAKEKLEQQKYKGEGEIADADLAFKLAVLDRDKYLEGEYKVEVDEKKGAIALAEKELQEATEKLEHYRKFVKNGFGTPEQLRAEEQGVEKAKYFLRRDKAKLEVLEKFTRQRQEAELTAKAKETERKLARIKSSTKAAVAEAQSEVDAADITARLENQTLKYIKAQLEKCVLTAPQDGILVYAKDRYWDPGSRIQPGATVWNTQMIFTIPDLTLMEVKVRVHEAMVKKVKVGQPVEIRVDAYAGKVLHGKVNSVGTLADNPPWDERGVKEYATVVAIEDLPLEAGLKPGMTAEVKILVNTLPDVLLVPVQCVTEKEGLHYSYVVKRSGVEKREVSVGDNNDKFVEIKTGLQEGEAIALDARSRIVAETKGKENGNSNGNGKKDAAPPKAEPPKPLAAGP